MTPPNIPAADEYTARNKLKQALCRGHLAGRLITKWVTVQMGEVYFRDTAQLQHKLFLTLYVVSLNSKLRRPAEQITTALANLSRVPSVIAAITPNLKESAYKPSSFKQTCRLWPPTSPSST
ncbi:MULTISPECIES: hypothetical protein [Methylobacter]